MIDIDGNGNTGDAGAQWIVGETFTDAINNISVNVVSATATGFQVKIICIPTIYTISGTPANGAGATLTYTGGSTTADGSGNYAFTVSPGWSGTVTPSKTGYTFSPVSKSYTNVTANQTAQDYTAKILPFTDILVMNGGAWNKYDFTTGSYLSGVWTGTAAGCTPALIDYDGDGAQGIQPALRWSLALLQQRWLLQQGHLGRELPRQRPRSG